MPLDDAPPLIRRLESRDIPWALDLAERCYRRPLGRAQWTAWVESALKLPNALILRGGSSCVVAEVYRTLPDSDELDGSFSYWFHEGAYTRELVRLFETAILWMDSIGVGRIWLRPTTGIDATPLARILGFDVAYPTFMRRM